MSDAVEYDEAQPNLTGAPSGALGDDAASFFRQLGEQTSKVLTAAEEAGRGIREQARRDAAAILAEARVQGDELARAAASQRRSAEEELRRFREARNILANQIEDVHRRLDEILLRLRAPIEDLDPGFEVAHHPLASGATGGGIDEAEAGRLSSGWAETASRRGDELERPDPADVTRPMAIAVPPGDTVAMDLGEIPGPLREQLAGPPPGAPESMLERVAAGVPAPPVEPEPAVEEVVAGASEEELAIFRQRAQALGEGPVQAGRSLKRLLQEDQNDLLDRIRRHRGRGSFDQEIFPAAPQVERFLRGLRGVLEPAFLAGRRLAGGPAEGEPDNLATNVVQALVSKQVVAPLRRDLTRMIEPRLIAGDTATTVSERAGDVYRVWKGVRTELLGEGLVYAAFHHGLIDAWREAHGAGKRWVVSTDETECPRDTCAANAAAGTVSLDASFPSGHLAPPAHGACTCTVVAAQV